MHTNNGIGISSAASAYIKTMRTEVTSAIMPMLGGSPLVLVVRWWWNTQPSTIPVRNSPNRMTGFV